MKGISGVGGLPLNPGFGGAEVAPSSVGSERKADSSIRIKSGTPSSIDQILECQEERVMLVVNRIITYFRRRATS